MAAQMDKDNRFSKITLKIYSFIHMCIHCLGHFSPLPLPPPSPPHPLHFQAEPVLPSSPILLKRRHKKDIAFLLELY
jgi:hypothetical protein